MRPVLQRAIAKAERAGVALKSLRWRPFSRLFLVSDSPLWVIEHEMRELARIATRLGVQIGSRQHPSWVTGQAVFFGSQFFLLDPRPLKTANRVGFAYFHGNPSLPVPEFATCFQTLAREHPRVARVQVSHSAMRDVVLESGIDPGKVFLIHIGINLEDFEVQTPESRRAAREAFGIPQQAVIVGSFQKDGVGWGEGLEPKLIKGPDVFLDAIRILRQRVPELFVLLSGPARGFVKAGLEELGVPYRHFYFRDFHEVGRLYQALDLYLVTSREEGGPKAVLEAMASGVPLVSTRVGQAADLVRPGQNGWLADVGNAEELAGRALQVVESGPQLASVLKAGRLTAAANSYDGQTEAWSALFDGFVEMAV